MNRCDYAVRLLFIAARSEIRSAMSSKHAISVRHTQRQHSHTASQRGQYGLRATGSQLPASLCVDIMSQGATAQPTSQKSVRKCMETAQCTPERQRHALATRAANDCQIESAFTVEVHALPAAIAVTIVAALRGSARVERVRADAPH